MRKSEATSPGLASLRANLGVAGVIFLLVLLGSFAFTREGIGGYNLEIVMQVGVAILLAVSLQLINGFSGQFSLGHAGFMAIGAYLSAYPSVNFGQEMSNPFAVILFFLALGSCVGLGGVLLFGLFLLARRSGRIHSSLPAATMVLIFVWIVLDISKASQVAPGQSTPPYVIFSVLIDIVERIYAGILATGMPIAQRISEVLPAALQRPLCFLALLAGGGACAAATGLVVGMPALRLRGDYLAIATLGFAEIIRVVITNTRPLGAALGLGEIPIYTNFGWLYGTAVATIVVIWRIAYSAKGRAIMAVRDDEVAAAAIGIDTTKQKVFAFVVGAFFAGVGGTLYAHYTGFITPTDFNFIRSIEFVVMVTLGGLGSISGAILAAIVLTLLPEVLRPIADWRMVIYALLLISMMLLRPQGLLGGRELWPGRWQRR